MGECSELAGGRGGGGVVVVVVTSWSEVEFVGNGKKRHHEVRRASERITNHKNCMKLLS